MTLETEVLWLDEHRVVSFRELVEISGLSEAELLDLVSSGALPASCSWTPRSNRSTASAHSARPSRWLAPMTRPPSTTMAPASGQRSTDSSG